MRVRIRENPKLQIWLKIHRVTDIYICMVLRNNRKVVQKMVVFKFPNLRF